METHSTPPPARVRPLSWVALMLSVVSALVLWPLWPPLVLAAWSSRLMQPLLERFARGLNGRRRAAAMISLLLFVAMVLPVTLLVLGVISGANELVNTVRASSSARAALETLLSPSREALPSSLTEVLTLAQRSGAQGLEVLTMLAGAAVTGLVGLVIYFGGAYSFLVDGPAAWRWFVERAPWPTGSSNRLAAAFHETGRGLLVGVGVTMLCQGLVATVVYAALGVPRAWVLGPITGLAAIVPFVGTSLVWAPIALGLFLTGNPIRGVVLVVLGLAVIGTVDNVLRPLFSRWGALQVPMFVLFISVFGGLVTFGAWGALMGPLVLRLTMEVLTMVSAPSPAAEAPP